MNIKKTIDSTLKSMEKLNIDNPLLEAQILLAAALKKDREFLLSHPEKEVSAWQNFLFQRMLKKRLAGYSNAVLVGCKWFYGLDFFVNKNVLVPRPETELMVEETLRIIINYKLSIINFIDIGTGSGCVAIALASELNKKNIKSNGYALDISKKALAVAKKNAKKHGVLGCIKFLHSDLLNIIDFKKFNEPIFITANLPYLTPEQIKNSPSIQKEPKMALESGKDGLNHYRRLLKQLENKKQETRENIFLFCEIDESQAAGIMELTQEVLPFAGLEIKKDLNGDNRLVIINIQ